jgi:hypothetical protein
MLNIIRGLFVLILAVIFQDAFAAEGESIVFNSTTGNYLITYYSDHNHKFKQIIFVPATKINPTIKNRLKLDSDGIIHYGHTLASAGNSQQIIKMYILDPVSSVTSRLSDIPLNAPPGKIAEDMDDVANYFDTPRLWSASMDYSDGQMSFRIGWSRSLKTGGLTPGSQATFGFKSRDLPGIIQAEVYGYAPDSQKIQEEMDNGDDDFGQQYEELVSRKNFVGRNAAVPTITVPSPFDAAALLDSIRTQVDTWPSKQLLDTAFAAQLDRTMVAAANAFRNNQPKAGREHIESLRRLLDHEHRFLDHDDEDNDDTAEHKAATRLTIDRLAARVLDFDLRYVLKRMEKEHEHDHDDGDHKKER